MSALAPARRYVVGAALLAALASAWWLRGPPEPPTVRLAPIVVPGPVPEGCGTVFGDVYCYNLEPGAER